MSGIVAINAGTLTLSGSNTYGGGTTLASGAQLNFNSPQAIGTGPLTINGGTIDATGGPIVNVNTNAENWNSDFTFGGTNPLNLGPGTVTVNANRQITVNGAGALTVGGSFNGGAYNLTKAGLGGLTLANANYTGTTTVSAGTLTVGGEPSERAARPPSSAPAAPPPPTGRSSASRAAPSTQNSPPEMVPTPWAQFTRPAARRMPTARPAMTT